MTDPSQPAAPDAASAAVGAGAGSDVEVEVVVVGAGVSGLAVARGLIEAGRSVIVAERRDRVGGRLLSIAPGADGRVEEGGGRRLDLGATWFWPGEPRVAALVEGFGIETHPQHLAGDAVYHDPSGAQRLAGNPIDVPSWRFAAGAQTLAEHLARSLPAGTLRPGTAVRRVVDIGGGLLVDVGDPGGIRGTHVVLALPPALAVHDIEFTPALPERLAGLAAVTPVWMGAVTKVVAVYERAFWRDRGLSGSAISHLGPMREIHDMSGPEGEPAALFGFIQGPGAGRTVAGGGPGVGDTGGTATGDTEDLVRRQLATLFGPDAGEPIELVLADWRRDPATSPPGVERLTAYQAFGHEGYHSPAMDGRLHWASTETGRVAPGHIEGALEAAERVVETIITSG